MIWSFATVVHGRQHWWLRAMSSCCPWGNYGWDSCFSVSAHPDQPYPSWELSRYQRVLCLHAFFSLLFNKYNYKEKWRCVLSYACFSIFVYFYFIWKKKQKLRDLFRLMLQPQILVRAGAGTGQSQDSRIPSGSQKDTDTRCLMQHLLLSRMY